MQRGATVPWGRAGTEGFGGQTPPRGLQRLPGHGAAQRLTPGPPRKRKEISAGTRTGTGPGQALATQPGRAGSTGRGTGTSTGDGRWWLRARQAGGRRDGEGKCCGHSASGQNSSPSQWVSPLHPLVPAGLGQTDIPAPYSPHSPRRARRSLRMRRRMRMRTRTRTTMTMKTWQGTPGAF